MQTLDMLELLWLLHVYHAISKYIIAMDDLNCLSGLGLHHFCAMLAFL